PLSKGRASTALLACGPGPVLGTLAGAPRCRACRMPSAVSSRSPSRASSPPVRPRGFQLQPDRLYLDARLLFEPQMFLGAGLAPRHSLEAGLVHPSHAQLGGRENPGLDDLVLRAVNRFGR